jgi:hypothetical protein
VGDDVTTPAMGISMLTILMDIALTGPRVHMRPSMDNTHAVYRFGVADRTLCLITSRAGPHAFQKSQLVPRGNRRPGNRVR